MIKGGKRGPVCVYVDEGESVEEAKAQYLAEHPEDPEASRLKIVQYRGPTKGAAVETELIVGV